MKFPFEAIYIQETEHVTWVKSQCDPELWHAVATLAVVAGDPYGFLPWVFEQPEVDRATAGYCFLGVLGDAYLQGQMEFGGEGLSDSQWLAMMEAICRRGATTGFRQDRIGLPDGFEPNRQACLNLVSEGRIAQGVIVPTAVLSKAFPRPLEIPYFLDDCSLLDHDPYQ